MYIFIYTESKLHSKFSINFNFKELGNLDFFPKKIEHN